MYVATRHIIEITRNMAKLLRKSLASNEWQSTPQAKRTLSHSPLDESDAPGAPDPPRSSSSHSHEPPCARFGHVAAP